MRNQHVAVGGAAMLLPYDTLQHENATVSRHWRRAEADVEALKDTAEGLEAQLWVAQQAIKHKDGELRRMQAEKDQLEGSVKDLLARSEHWTREALEAREARDYWKAQAGIAKKVIDEYIEKVYAPSVEASQ